MNASGPDDRPLGARVIRALDAWLDEHGELAKLAPYAGKAVAAYRLVRQRRMRAFLLALDYEVSRGGQDAKRRLDELIASDSGADLLADFADSTLRTASKTAVIALAILYTDTDDAAYPALFKAKACAALAGLAERAVELFLLLSSANRTDEVKENKEHPSPFPVYPLATLAARLPRIRELLPTRADELLAIGDLQRRGLVLPDHATRLSGGATFFGAAEDASLFRRLLSRASALRVEHPDLDAV